MKRLILLIIIMLLYSIIHFLQANIESFKDLDMSFFI